jgi:hypothetical protein
MKKRCSSDTQDAGGRDPGLTSAVLLALFVFRSFFEGFAT